MSVRNAAKKQIITGLALICGYIGSMAVSKMLGGMPLFGAFLFTACAMIPAGLLMAAAAGRTGGTDQENVQAVRSVRAYRALNRVSTPVMAAAALTANALFALLGIRREWIGSAMAAGILCSAAAAGLGRLLLRGLERKKQRDPTWLMAAGLLVWLIGAVPFCRNMPAEREYYIRIFVSLAMCAFGGTLALTGLYRAEQIMPRALCAAGIDVPAGYLRMRTARWSLSRIAGEAPVLTALGLFLYLLPAGGDGASETAGWLPPAMAAAVMAAVLSALVCVYLFPVDSRFIRRLERYTALRDEGRENAALLHRIEPVVKEPYRQPNISRFLIAVIRRVYSHRVIDAEHIEPDDSNPLVFLCNHGEFYGPIICNVFIPVPVRSWTFSMMMFDQKEVTAYIYENTFSQMKNQPVMIRKMLARFFGWLSVTVMNQIESIPVYRDSPLKLRETVRQSIEAMEAGDNLLIFPEDPSYKYATDGIGELSPGFVMLAEAYWKKTHKKLRIMPMYANKTERTVTFGNPITYEPEAGFSSEQDRIVQETIRQIRTMAGKNVSDNSDLKEREGRR